MGDRHLQAVALKPAREEWFRWAGVVIDRLTTCVHIYSKPPHDDVFVADSERQGKNGRTLDLLRRIHALTDEADTPTDSLDDLEHHDERVIAGLAVLLRDMMNLLPDLSADMQKFLKSPWYDNCNGRLATELFRGPLGREPEGIGSGYTEHGRLPLALQELLEQEQAGDTRPMRDALHREDKPQRQDEAQQRRRNPRYLRSAGQVE
ncbi:MAG: hypothetical protein SFW62_05025 [Alphaproteobacteria bacterium]|nr:hypothetical protein [Alphaproteobacteria bacterium]